LKCSASITMGLGAASASLCFMVKASRLPSGDHAYSPMSPPTLVSGRASPPRRSNSMICALSAPEGADMNARYRPSGLHLGLPIPSAAAVSASLWLPSQLTIQIALRASSDSRSFVVTT
jgi:hypothetical protein